MLYIIISVVCATYLVLAFKVFERVGINGFHAIVVNYVVCVVTGSVMNGGAPRYIQNMHAPWLWCALMLGCSFITFFNLMDVVTRKQGITVTSVATKLSMVIPFSLSIYLYHEPLTVLKIIGITVSLLAVYLTSRRENIETHAFSWRDLWLPAVLFLGSGANDSLVKVAKQQYLGNASYNDFNIVIFSVAACAGLVLLAYDVSVRRTEFRWQVLIAGVALGVPNYFSMYFLLKALEVGDASLIYPFNNLGIVALSALSAELFFREKLSRGNWLGLGLAVTAILLMTLGR